MCRFSLLGSRVNCVPMRLFDSHIHLDDPRFDADRERLLADARAVGVSAMVVPGVSADTWQRTLRVCRASPGCHPALGLHPYFLDRHAPAQLDELEALLGSGDVVAVGECGLDFAIRELDRDRQAELFDAQLALADKYSMPVVVHSRQAVDQVSRHLRRYPGVRAHIHSFSGSEQQARRLVDLGCVLGIGATITFDRAQRLRRIVAALPLECLCVETDAPDQPGQGHRGERHLPAHITEVVATIAELRATSVEAVASATFSNAAHFFGLETVHV